MRVALRSPHDREIVRLALPALGALAADPLVSLVDTAYVGRLGTTALGALAVAAAVFGVAFAGFNFLSYGTTPLVARRLGSGDHDGAASMAGAAGLIAVGSGAMAAIALAVFAEQLLRILGASPELVASGSTYLRIRALALPAVLLATAGHGVFRGAQDTRTPFLIALGLNAVNFVLDPILIFVAGWGLAGAAWATVIAQWLGAAAFVIVLAVRGDALGVGVARPALTDAAELATAGGRLVLRTAGLLAVFTATTAVAARLGTPEVAAHQIALQLFIFLSLVLDAVAIAAQAMLGKAVGEAVPATVRALADRLVVLGGIAGLLLGLLLALAAPWLPYWFSPDEAVVQQLRSVYVQLVLVQVIGGAVFAWDGIVMGVTDFTYAMTATVVPAVATVALLLAILPLGGTLAMVWWAVVLLMVQRAGLLAWWHGRRFGLAGQALGGT